MVKEELPALLVLDLGPAVHGCPGLGGKRGGGLVDGLGSHGCRFSASRRTCAKCIVLTGKPSRAANPDRCMRQLVSPETRTSGFAARTWPSFRSPMAAEMCGKPTENVPPKPQHCSASPKGTSRNPAIDPSSSATASLLAVPRVWHERCRATADSNRPGQDLTPSPFTMKSPSSHVRRPRLSTSSRSGSRSNSSAAPWKSIAAQDPEGTTTGSSPENVRTVCRTTRRDAAQSPPLNAGWPQHVWPPGNATSQPRCSSSSTVAAATSSWNASHRHVAISCTRLPAIGVRPGLGIIGPLRGRLRAPVSAWVQMIPTALPTASALIGSRLGDRMAPRPSRGRGGEGAADPRVRAGEPGHLAPGSPRPPQRLAPDRLDLDPPAGEVVDEARRLVAPHCGRHVELPRQVGVGNRESERRRRALDLAHELARLACEGGIGADPVRRDAALGDGKPVERDVPDKLPPTRLEQVPDDVGLHARRAQLRGQAKRALRGGPAKLADRHGARMEARDLAGTGPGQGHEHEAADDPLLAEEARQVLVGPEPVLKREQGGPRP